jgi:hypothetical protein
VTDVKDTFHTFGYRCGFIHCCENRTTGKSEVKVQRYEGDKARSAKSVQAAKQIIGIYCKKEGKS